VSRWWNEFMAVIDDIVPGGLLLLTIGLLVVATIVALLWYFWPPRLPGFLRRGRDRRRDRTRRRRRWRFRWPTWRWLRWRWRWRRRRRAATPEPAELAPDELPDLPAEVLALTADQLAAAGRYAEAVRERLRAIVRELVEREVIAHRPGWTVTELARTAGRARPAAAPPLAGASDVFSGIWYGLRPASVDDDLRMRAYADEVHAAVEREWAR
jgi:hypothetical protein